MCCDTNKIRVDLTGAPETMLATLYARALDADAADSRRHPRQGVGGAPRLRLAEDQRAFRPVDAPVPGRARGGDGAAPGVWPRQQGLACAPGPRRRVVRRPLPV